MTYAPHGEGLYGIQYEDGTVVTDPDWDSEAAVLKSARPFSRERRILGVLVVLTDGEWIPVERTSG